MLSLTFLLSLLSSINLLSCKAVLGLVPFGQNTLCVWMIMHQFVSFCTVLSSEDILKGPDIPRCTPGHERYVLSFTFWKCHSHRIWHIADIISDTLRGKKNNNYYVLGPAFGSWGNTKPCCCIVDTLHCGVAVWTQARWCNQSWGWRSFPGLLKCEMCHITYPQADNGPGSVLFTSTDVISESNNLGEPKSICW